MTLERKTPLTQRTALARGKGLVARSALKAKTGLKPQSKKTGEAYVGRRVFVAEFLKKYPWCQVQWDLGCWGKSVDVHERLFRSHGGHIVGEDDGHFIATCRYCHSMIHDNPREAKARGFRE